MQNNQNGPSRGIILAPNQVQGTVIKGGQNHGIKNNTNASFFMGASLISPTAATSAASGISNFIAVDSND